MGLAKLANRKMKQIPFDQEGTFDAANSVEGSQIVKRDEPGLSYTPITHIPPTVIGIDRVIKIWLDGERYRDVDNFHFLAESPHNKKVAFCFKKILIAG